MKSILIIISNPGPKYIKCNREISFSRKKPLITIKYYLEDMAKTDSCFCKVTRNNFTGFEPMYRVRVSLKSPVT